MKLNGTTALYSQLKELEAAVAITKRQIALAEEFGAEDKPKKTRRGRKAKANGSEGLIEAAAKRIMGPDLREGLANQRDN